MINSKIDRLVTIENRSLFISNGLNGENYVKENVQIFNTLLNNIQTIYYSVGIRYEYYRTGLMVSPKVNSIIFPTLADFCS